jgi:hypothetical protein
MHLPFFVIIEGFVFRLTTLLINAVFSAFGDERASLPIHTCSLIDAEVFFA